MADSYIQVAADSTGKKLQTFKNTIGLDEVHAEAVSLTDTAGVAITTLPVSLASVPSHAVTNAGTFATQTTKIAGAANMANGQVTSSTSAATLVPARATRRSVTIRNTDSSISVYVGIATVTSVNGMLLKAGESISLDFTGLVQVISASGSPVVAYVETYD